MKKPALTVQAGQMPPAGGICPKMKGQDVAADGPGDEAAVDQEILGCDELRRIRSREQHQLRHLDRFAAAGQRGYADHGSQMGRTPVRLGHDQPGADGVHASAEMTRRYQRRRDRFRVNLTKAAGL